MNGDNYAHMHSQDLGVDQITTNPTNDKTYVDPDKKKTHKQKSALQKRRASLVLGEEVIYGNTRGVLVSKGDGIFLNVYNQDNDRFDPVHIEDITKSDEILTPDSMDVKIWDTLEKSDRVRILEKIGINSIESEKDWYDFDASIRKSIRLITKNSYFWTQPAMGAQGGSEPGFYREEDFQSFRNNDKRHINAPYETEQAEAFIRNKADPKKIIEREHELLNEKPDKKEEDVHEQIIAETKKDGTAGPVSTGTEGVSNPVYGETPKSKEKKKSYSTRYGMRYGVTSIDESPKIGDL